MKGKTQLVSLASLVVTVGCGAAEVPRAVNAATDSTAASAPPAVVAESLWVDVPSLVLVGFHPFATDSMLERDEELATVLDDFGHHLSTASSSLRALGFAVDTRIGDSLHLRSPARSWHWGRAADSANVGFYLADSAGRSRVVYGVRTNSDLVAFADSFARSRVP